MVAVMGGLRQAMAALLGRSWRPARSIYYHHIGKTGGTSINRMLVDAVVPQRVCPTAGLSRQLLDAPQRFELFSGHFPYAVVNLLPQPTVVITSVREPLQHAVSTYNHLKRLGGSHIVLTHRRRPLATFDDFLEDPVLRRITTNPQAFSLGREIATPRLREVAARLPASNWTETGTTDDFWALYGTEEDDRHDGGLLRVALGRLDDPLTIACTCETIDRDFNRIKAVIGLAHAGSTDRPARLNAKPRRDDMLDVSDLSAAQAADVRSRTALDLEVYEHVARRMAGRAAA